MQRFFLLIFLCVLSGNIIAAGVPQMIFHGGIISVDGRTFTGIGYFKFAITNLHSNCSNASTGCTSLWSNDNTSTTGNEPINSIALDVIEGNYSIQLGDISRINHGTTIQMAPIPGSVFSEGETLLRIWFSDNGADKWQQLLPDRQLISVPYALRAQTADTAINSIGEGQKWIDVSTEKTQGVVYKNDTTRPIMVNMCIQKTNLSNPNATLYVIDSDNNKVLVGTAGDTNSPEDRGIMSTIVPSGHSYQFNLTGGAMLCWAELR